MIRFEYQFDDKSEKIVMELPGGSNLDEVTDAFARFLRAATYNFDGDVIIYDSKTEPYIAGTDFDSTQSV